MRKKLGISTFLQTHPKLSALYMSFVIIVGFVGIANSKRSLLSFFAIFFSAFALFRLFTYKVGKIPIFMTDTLWEKCRIKYSEEEAEKKYKEKSLKSATTCFIFGIAAHVIWIVCEIVSLLI